MSVVPSVQSFEHSIDLVFISWNSYHSMLASCCAMRRAVYALFNDVNSRQESSAYVGCHTLVGPVLSVSQMSAVTLMTEFAIDLDISVEVTSLCLTPCPSVTV